MSKRPGMRAAILCVVPQNRRPLALDSARPTAMSLFSLVCAHRCWVTGGWIGVASDCATAPVCDSDRVSWMGRIGLGYQCASVQELPGCKRWSPRRRFPRVRLVHVRGGVAINWMMNDHDLGSCRAVSWCTRRVPANGGATSTGSASRLPSRPVHARAESEGPWCLHALSCNGRASDWATGLGSYRAAEPSIADGLRLSRSALSRSL